jgi:hypothetical protein
MRIYVNSPQIGALSITTNISKSEMSDITGNESHKYREINLTEKH